MTHIDPHIQIGDIRVADHEGEGLARGELVEIIEEDFPGVNRYWKLKHVSTGELWDPSNSLSEKRLQQLVSRANDTYEVCD